jgi:hypothetical protein
LSTPRVSLSVSNASPIVSASAAAISASRSSCLIDWASCVWQADRSENSFHRSRLSGHYDASTQERQRVASD